MRRQRLLKFCTIWNKKEDIPNHINIPTFNRAKHNLERKPTYAEFKEWYDEIKRKYSSMDNEEYVMNKFN